MKLKDKITLLINIIAIFGITTTGFFYGLTDIDLTTYNPDANLALSTVLLLVYYDWYKIKECE